jgi:hypothetical protein
MVGLTDFYTIPPKEESRQNHLPESKTRTKGREERDRNYTEDINEKDDQNRINESKVENWVG